MTIKNITKSIIDTSAKMVGCKRVDGYCIKGTALAAALNRRIDAMADGDSDERQAIIRRMAANSGSARGFGRISVSTVNQILRGDINCPPLVRLEGFAETLNVSVASLRSAAERDGCNYDT